MVSGFLVVADGINVRRGSLHETVHQAVIDLDARAVVAVVRIVIIAAGPIGRQVVRRMAHAVHVHIFQAGLPAIGVGQPTQEVIEAAVLHHRHDDVFDLRSGRPHDFGAERRAGGQSARSFQECSAIHFVLLL